jgi:hypothetical protein
MRTKTVLILIFFYASIFGQSSSDNSVVKNITLWVNPKSDSIKSLKLKDITRYKITGNDIKVDFKTMYNQDGYILIHGNYSFKYDAQNNLTNIKYPDPHSKIDFALDSITIDNNVDTNKIFSALYLYNNIFYKKFRRYISKDGKAMDTYTDTLISCNGAIIRYNSKSKADFDCHITNLVLPNLSYNKNGYKETYKYDFGYQPPNIEFTQTDTLGKFKRTYIFLSTKTDEDSPIFSGYFLSFVHTEIKGNEFIDDIEEYYNNGESDKISKFPVYIIQSKQFPDKTEIYEYEGKSAKTKKLKSFYTLKTDYSYFK